MWIRSLLLRRTHVCDRAGAFKLQTFANRLRFGRTLRDPFKVLYASSEVRVLENVCRDKGMAVVE